MALKFYHFGQLPTECKGNIYFRKAVLSVLYTNKVTCNTTFVFYFVMPLSHDTVTQRKYKKKSKMDKMTKKCLGECKERCCV